MTVFVVQEPVIRDRSTGDIRPRFDLTPASRYGDLEVLLPAGNVVLSAAPMVKELRSKLMRFSDEDYLVCVGDPSAIAVAASIAASFNNGRYKLLKWDRREHGYIVVPVNLHPFEKEEN